MIGLLHVWRFTLVASGQHGTAAASLARGLADLGADEAMAPLAHAVVPLATGRSRRLAHRRGAAPVGQAARVSVGAGARPEVPVGADASPVRSAAAAGRARVGLAERAAGP